ncbi:MAG: DUF4962 domain-containing protein [Planctomycetes bacterium]|nr:DUF4962 domain-containing protein [Planctomycetota bacterium]
MPPTTYGDVITGVSPLENELAGVHPRLYADATRIALLRTRLTQQPWKRMFDRLKRIAEAVVEAKPDPAQISAAANVLPSLAMMWLLTDDRRYLDAASKRIEFIAAAEQWNKPPREKGSFFMGHVLFETSLAYDWLYHGLDPALRDRLRDALAKGASQTIEDIALQRVFFANALGHNHTSNIHTDLVGSVCALYGEVPDAGPWAKVALDRVRLMASSLGPDGVSSEGICYGGYYAHSFTKILTLCQELLGVDLFKSTPWMRRLPLFYAYSQFSRKHWANVPYHMCFGDGVKWDWFGPAHFMRRLASVYGDGVAQWIADETDSDTVQCPDNAPYLNILWHDPAVTPIPPAKALPTARHFEDNGLVLMRSSWNEEDIILGFRCGPHSGHHAMRNFTSDVGGGHMQPDTGSFQIIAGGEWLIPDGGYCIKHTKYRNTILVNGTGQTGDGGEWFENIELRRTGRGPSVTRFEHTAAFDQVVGDMTQAYEAAPGRSLVRAVLFLKPGTVVVADMLRDGKPAAFEWWYHAEQEWRPVGPRSWEAKLKEYGVRLSCLAPQQVRATVAQQPIESIGPHNGRTLSALRLELPDKAESIVSVTVLQVSRNGEATPAAPEAIVSRDRVEVSLPTADGRRKFALTGIETTAPRWAEL